MHSYKCNLYFTTFSVSDLERTEICEKYNGLKTKELLKNKLLCRSNSFVGSAACVIRHSCVQLHLLIH